MGTLAGQHLCLTASEKRVQSKSVSVRPCFLELLQSFSPLSLSLSWSASSSRGHERHTLALAQCPADCLPALGLEIACSQAGTFLCILILSTPPPLRLQQSHIPCASSSASLCLSINAPSSPLEALFHGSSILRLLSLGCRVSLPLIHRPNAISSPSASTLPFVACRCVSPSSTPDPDNSSPEHVSAPAFDTPALVTTASEHCKPFLVSNTCLSRSCFLASTTSRFPPCWDTITLTSSRAGCLPTEQQLGSSPPTSPLKVRTHQYHI